MIEQWWRRNGLALPAVMVIVLFLIIMGMGILELGTLETFEAIKSQNRMRAFYLAEAGAQRAMELIANNEDWEGSDFWDDDHELGQGGFAVDYNKGNDDVVTLTAEGEVGDQTETVYVTVSVGGGGGPFSRGVFGSDKIEMEGNAAIYGYDSSTGEETGEMEVAGSNTEIEMEGSTLVDGDAWVAEKDGILLDGSAEITGKQSDDESPLELPDVDIPPELLSAGPGGEMELEKRESHTLTEGDYRYEEIEVEVHSELIIDGDVRLYVEDSFNFSNHAALTIEDDSSLELYIGEDGEFDLESQARINEDGEVGDLSVYSRGEDMEIEGRAQLVGAIYAPYSETELSGKARIWGGIISKYLEISGNVEIYHDNQLFGKSGPGGGNGGSTGGIELIKWTKEKAWRDYYEQTQE